MLPDYIIGNREQKPRKTPVKKPVDPLEIPNGYPWPSSKLGRVEMARLCELRVMFRKPITALIRDSINTYWELVKWIEEQTTNPELAKARQDLEQPDLPQQDTDNSAPENDVQ